MFLLSKLNLNIVEKIIWNDKIKKILRLKPKNNIKKKDLQIYQHILTQKILIISYLPILILS